MCHSSNIWEYRKKQIKIWFRRKLSGDSSVFLCAIEKRKKWEYTRLWFLPVVIYGTHEICVSRSWSISSATEIWARMGGLYEVDHREC
jgi:hypothetical protein